MARIVNITVGRRLLYPVSCVKHFPSPEAVLDENLMGPSCVFISEERRCERPTVCLRHQNKLKNLGLGDIFGELCPHPTWNRPEHLYCKVQQYTHWLFLQVVVCKKYSGSRCILTSNVSGCLMKFAVSLSSVMIPRYFAHLYHTRTN